MWSTSSTVNITDEQALAMQQTITGRVVGPVSAKQFLNFLPPAKPFPKFEKLSSKLMRMRDELSRDMYDLWVDIFNPLCKSVGGWSLVHIRQSANFHGMEPKFYTGLLGPHSPQAGHKNLHDIEAVEVLHDCLYAIWRDPFDDKEPSFEMNKPLLGQLALTAAAQMAAQFRTHIFSVLVFRAGSYARLLRWDRAGVVVTEKIPFDKPAIPEFYWRYCHASATECGHDASVQCFSEDSDLDEAQADSFREKLSLNEETCLFRLNLGEGKGSYIVEKPMFMGVSLEPTGQSTHIFNAICEQDGSLVILKDTWRITGGGQLPEHKVYEKLYKGQVRHIAQVKEGADILSHETITHRAAEKWFPSKNFPKILTCRHYRLVLPDVGHDLQAFSSVKGLVSTIHDALIAHEDAYFNANILHQDISVKNIVVVGDGHGLLIDWDMCKDLGNMSQTQEYQDAAQHKGTWQYMAARLLIKKNQSAHNREDDLESFYHVLNWMALHYTSHNMNSEDLTHNLQRIFEESYRAPDGTPMGGWSKLDTLLTGTINQNANFQNPPLANLLETIRKLVAVRYQGQKGGQLDGLLHMPYYFSSLFAKALAEDEQWDVNGDRIEHFPPLIDPDPDPDSDSDSGSGSGSNFE